MLELDFYPAYWSIVIITLLSLVFGIVLGIAAIKLKVKEDPIVEKIDRLLPQSQCGQCGYPGCLPYAQAVANGDDITKCVPGGQPLVVKLAGLLGVEIPQMDGVEAIPLPSVAFIDEPMCIGCTKCIQVCPVDAIIGGNKSLHTVIPDLCTGCELCISPCPTNCISMHEVKPTLTQWNWQFKPELMIPVQNIQSHKMVKGE